MESGPSFADVILPLAMPQLLTYAVPEELWAELMPGQRVVVPVGNKIYTAIVYVLHKHAPVDYRPKSLEGALDDRAIVPMVQLKLWKWISEYYMCSLGEVMSAALPSSLKLASESKIVYNAEFSRDWSQLNDREFLVAEALQMQDALTLQEIAEIIGQKTVQPLIKSLIEKGVAFSYEELQHQYKPKKEVFVRLSEAFASSDTMSETMEVLESKAPKQLALLLGFMSLTGKDEAGWLSRSLVQKKLGLSASLYTRLQEKGIFELEEREIGRILNNDVPVEASKALSEKQQLALSEIKTAWESHQTVLLHGVTSSGKTEIYVQLITETLAAGKQVLFLLPEIALTTQLINRLKRYFGKRVGVYHSRFNQHERVEIWQKVLDGRSGEYDIVLGARSALFLPFKKLGLVIVDEEHESSFKQHDPAPRYNARDMAVVLTGLHKAKLLLGSATPSIETFWNCQENRFGLVTLMERFGGMVMPEIQCADIKAEMKKRTMRGIFTAYLANAMEETLKQGKQIILFQNRRGFSPLWQCAVCGDVPHCTRCDVSLTYHKYSHQLKCHYCGYQIPPPAVCKACGSNELKMLGFGTEKIEEEVLGLFPKARVQRMDLETTRSKYAYERIIQAFEDGEVDVLVGTQMVTKGLDFDHVGLVGVLNADQMLNFPDFRSFERSYQLLSQVAGRAGRKGERGKVILQTYTPDHWVILKVMAHDYLGLYQQELLERRNFHYPPFYRIIKLLLKDRDQDVVSHAAEALVHKLKAGLSERVLGPEAPAVSRVNNAYIRQILIKTEREASTVKLKDFVRKAIDELKAQPEFRRCRVNVDVDPV